MKNSSPKKLSANSRPTNGQQSADCWQKIFVKAVNDSRPTVGRLSANSWPTVGRQSDDSRPTVGQLSAHCRPTVGRLSADCRPTVGRLLADCWPTVGRQFFGGAVLHFFPILFVSFFSSLSFFFLLMWIEIP